MWNKDDAEGFVTSLDQMDYYIKEILKINIKDYIFQDLFYRRNHI